MIKKIIVVIIAIISIAAVISYGVYENMQIEKKFNLKKEKALKIINTEIEKRENLNKKMEKLASDFSAEYENNLNNNLIVIKNKIEKATNEKELLKIISELD